MRKGFVVLLILCVSLGLSLATSPVGYIARIEGKGTFKIIRGKKAIVVDAAALKKEILLYPGDKFEFPNKNCVVYYFDHNVIRRQPTRTGVCQPVGSAPIGPKCAKSLEGGRPQGQLNQGDARVLANLNEKNVYHVSEWEESEFAWVQQPDDKADFVRVKQDGNVLVEKAVSHWNTSSLGVISVFSDPDVSKAVRKVKPGSAFELSIVFKNKKTAVATLTRYDGRVRFMDDALSVLNLEKMDSVDWFEALNNAAVEFENAGCNIQSSILAIKWWMSEPNNAAACSAVRGASVRFEIAAIERFLGDGKTKDK
jgi:hypothetical protein